ncbi:MAG: retropepsin-like domain-containing protein [Saprospiraceae bacterium]|nr:retropepsin-like domain-containing protein [Saprospiraceae bacterium]
MASFKLYITLLLVVFFNNTLQGSYTTVPFHLEGKLIIIQATVDGQVGNFILDTGISDLLLNSRYFEGDQTEQRFLGLNGQGGTLELSRPTVQIGNQSWGRLNAKIVPMVAIERSKGIRIHGLLGTDIFRKFTLLIDYRKRKLQLYPLDRKGENSTFAQESLPKEILAFKYKGGTPLIGLHLGDIELKLTLDTGAEVNLFDNKYLDQLRAFIGQRRQHRLYSFGNEAREATFTSLSGVRTTKGEVAEMNTAFASLDHYNRHVIGPKTDGILGYEFLQQFRVAINFKKREVYLWEKESELIVSAGK